jgi:molecular chaperone Hsp33
MSADHIASAMAAGDYVRVLAARTTDVVIEAQSRHGCSPTATAALGRLLTGAAMMGFALNGRERIALQVAGDGPVRRVHAEVRPDGRVRGYVEEPLADVPLNSRGKFDVAGLIGSGSLHVTRTFDSGQPYTSAVRLVSGEIGEDLAHYFARSEQIPTIVAVGVLAGPRGVVAAGGVLAQLLPGADDDTTRALEERAKRLGSVSTLINDGSSPDDLIHELTADLSPRITAHHEVSFSCSCDRARVIKALLGFGRAQLETMAREDEVTEARCDFCGATYHFGRDELREIVAAATTSA